jgi:hypothetical protein
LNGHIEALTNEVERLQTIIDRIRQGRVMRLLDSINRFVSGGPPE